jgi:formate dehydrogenase iron-sulfur subunit
MARTPLPQEPETQAPGQEVTGEKPSFPGDKPLRPVNRRDFVRLIVAAGVGGTCAPALAQEYFPGWPDRLGMLTDLSLCVGCRRCEAACKEINRLPPLEVPLDDESAFAEKRRTHAQAFTVVNRYGSGESDSKTIYVKSQCMHCNEPACASACPVRAFTKTPEGAVIYNENVCIGCRYCMVACPFNIPAYEYDNAYTPAVRKCTLCFDRISQGEVPACADACPMEAITVGKRSELIKLAREKIRRRPDQYVDHIYGEYEVGGTSWLYLSPVPFEQLGFRTDLGITPYPQLTRGFLSMVPLVLALWPALLIGCYSYSKRREEVTKAEVSRAEQGGAANR